MKLAAAAVAPCASASSSTFSRRRLTAAPAPPLRCMPPSLQRPAVHPVSLFSLVLFLGLDSTRSTPMQSERQERVAHSAFSPFNLKNRQRQRNGGACLRLVLLLLSASRTPLPQRSPSLRSSSAPRVLRVPCSSPWAPGPRPWQTPCSPPSRPSRRGRPRHGPCSWFSRSQWDGLVGAWGCLLPPTLPLLACPSRVSSVRPWPSTARRWPGSNAEFR